MKDKIRKRVYIAGAITPTNPEMNPVIEYGMDEKKNYKKTIIRICCFRQNQRKRINHSFQGREGKQSRLFWKLFGMGAVPSNEAERMEAGVLDMQKIISY